MALVKAIYVIKIMTKNIITKHRKARMKWLKHIAKSVPAQKLSRTFWTMLSTSCGQLCWATKKSIFQATAGIPLDVVEFGFFFVANNVAKGLLRLVWYLDIQCHNIYFAIIFFAR